jgi:hypothetical protein
MPPNDVVKHDLTSANDLGWARVEEPMPLPIVKGGENFGPPSAAPVTTMIDSPTIGTAPYRSVGLMRLMFDTKKTLNGSGWVVARRAFITAGHCV